MDTKVITFKWRWNYSYSILGKKLLITVNPSRVCWVGGCVCVCVLMPCFFFFLMRFQLCRLVLKLQIYTKGEVTKAQNGSCDCKSLAVSSILWYQAEEDDILLEELLKSWMSMWMFILEIWHDPHSHLYYHMMRSFYWRNHISFTFTGRRISVKES